MAMRISKIYGGKPIINIFTIQDDFRTLQDIKIKDFGEQIMGEWARFVMNNRNRSYQTFAKGR